MQDYLEICQYISNMPDSELSNNINSLSDVSNVAKNAINGALNTLWFECRDCNFRTIRREIYISKYDSKFPLSSINGIIKIHGVKIDGKPLRFELNPDDLPKREGTPTKYWIEGEYLKFWPRCDIDYNVKIKYRNKCMVDADDNGWTTKLVNEKDILLVSEWLEDEFLICLGSLTNMLLNGNPTSTGYIYHKSRYLNALAALKICDTGTEESPVKLRLI